MSSVWCKSNGGLSGSVGWKMEEKKKKKRPTTLLQVHFQLPLLAFDLANCR